MAQTEVLSTLRAQKTDENAKVGAPQILTESDKILENFRQEIEDINQRVKQLEEERGQFEHIWQDTHKKFQHSLQLLSGEKRKTTAQTEEMQVVGQILQDWQQPVQEVVDNLGKIGAAVEDAAVKSSIDDCYNTAQYVLTLFNKSQSLITGLTQKVEAPKTQPILLRQWLPQKLQMLKQQTDWRLRLFIGAEVPESLICHEILLLEALTSTLPPLAEHLHTKPEASLHIEITLKPATTGVPEHILLRLLGKPSLGWPLKSDWVDNFHLNPEKQNLPMDWLVLRHKLQSFQGNLTTLAQDEQMIGVEITLPINQP